MSDETPARRLAKATLERAQVLWELDNQGQALKDFQEAFTTVPDLAGLPYSKAIYQMGIRKQDNGDLEGAMKDFLFAAQIAPEADWLKEIQHTIDTLERKLHPPEPEPEPELKPALALTCPNCGKEVQTKWEFCPYCSAGLKPPAPVQITECPNCGEHIEQEWEFCPRCSINLKTVYKKDNHKIKPVESSPVNAESIALIQDKENTKKIPLPGMGSSEVNTHTYSTLAFSSEKEAAESDGSELKIFNTISAVLCLLGPISLLWLVGSLSTIFDSTETANSLWSSESISLSLGFSCVFGVLPLVPLYYTYHKRFVNGKRGAAFWVAMILTGVIGYVIVATVWDLTRLVLKFIMKPRNSELIEFFWSFMY